MRAGALEPQTGSGIRPRVGAKRPTFDNGSYVGMTDRRGATAKCADSWAGEKTWRRMKDEPVRLCEKSYTSDSAPMKSGPSDRTRDQRGRWPLSPHRRGDRTRESRRIDPLCPLFSTTKVRGQQLAKTPRGSRMITNNPDPAGVAGTGGCAPRTTKSTTRAGRRMSFRSAVALSSGC